jgi:addiction module HigA family antidote
MLPTNRVSTAPGELLLELYLKPAGVTQKVFAKHIGKSEAWLSDIIKAKRGVTAVTAILFAQALGTSPELWLNAQAAFEITSLRVAKKTPKVKRMAAFAESHAA